MLQDFQANRSRLRTTGVVIYPPVRFEGGQTNFYFNDCREQLRFFITYFSKVGYLPLNIPPPFMLDLYTPACLMSEDIQILLQQGIVQPFVFPDREISLGYGDPIPYIQDLFQAYFVINNHCGGGWAICPPKSITLNDNIGELNSLVFRLRGLFPSPDLSVPIHDIIDFRERHSDILQDLHASIDDLSISWRSELDELQFRVRRDLDRLEEALRSARFPFFRADFSVTRALAKAAIETFVSSLAPGASSTVLGFAGGLLEIEPRSSRRAVQGNQYPQYFEYIYLGRKRLPLDYQTKSDDGHVIFGLSFPNNVFIPVLPDGLVEERSFHFRPPGPGVMANVFG